MTITGGKKRGFFASMMDKIEEAKNKAPQMPDMDPEALKKAAKAKAIEQATKMAIEKFRDEGKDGLADIIEGLDLTEVEDLSMEKVKEMAMDAAIEQALKTAVD